MERRERTQKLLLAHRGRSFGVMSQLALACALDSFNSPYQPREGLVALAVRGILGFTIASLRAFAF
jgi:hypothetical protein